MEAWKIKLRYAGCCRECGIELPRGETAWHFAAEKKVECGDCHAAAAPTGDQVGQLLGVAPRVVVAEVPEQPLPGTSAEREYLRRTRRRQDDLEDRWGSKLGKIVWRLEAEKQSTSAWSTGATGEKAVGAHLEKKLANKRCVLLHDRAIPGSRANIDHVAIGPSGVTVIDAKNVSGNVRAVTKGIGKRKRQLLMVNGRDRTKMIAGVVGQVEVVSSLLEDVQPPIVVPVRGIICWWKYEGLPLIGTNRIEIDGVRVLNRNGSAQIAGDAGAMSDAAISVVADFLDAQLRPS